MAKTQTKSSIPSWVKMKEEDLTGIIKNLAEEHEPSMIGLKRENIELSHRFVHFQIILVCGLRETEDHSSIIQWRRASVHLM